MKLLRHFWALGPLSVLLLAPLLNGSTIDFTSAAAYAAATTSSFAVSFNDILSPGTSFENFNPLVLSGTSFSTPDAGTFVNVTTATFYAPNNYRADFIVNSTNSSSSNTLVISLPSTYALALDFGGLGFNGASTATITLSNGHVFTAASLPTVGSTEFVGFVSTDALTSLTLVTTNDSWVVQDFTTSSPVPEPATLVMWVVGLVALPVLRRRPLR
ncbi:MAG: hypothetical protein JOZ45_21155 [Acidobacteriaceae bacterium]|nr:hypothetical protein [Acidobacteriaceae bacterium]